MKTKLKEKEEILSLLQQQLNNYTLDLVEIPQMIATKRIETPVTSRGHGRKPFVQLTKQSSKNAVIRSVQRQMKLHFQHECNTRGYYSRYSRHW
jgi:hypothetical protein